MCFCLKVQNTRKIQCKSWPWLEKRGYWRWMYECKNLIYTSFPLIGPHLSINLIENVPPDLQKFWNLLIFFVLSNPCKLYDVKSIKSRFTSVFSCVNLHTLRRTSRIWTFLWYRFYRFSWIWNFLCERLYELSENKYFHIQLDKWSPLLTIQAILLCKSPGPHPVNAHTQFIPLQIILVHLLRVTNGNSNNTLHLHCVICRNCGCHSVYGAVCVGCVDPPPLPAQGTPTSTCHRCKEQKTQPGCRAMQT